MVNGSRVAASLVPHRGRNRAIRPPAPEPRPLTAASEHHCRDGPASIPVSFSSFRLPRFRCRIGVGRGTGLGRLRKEMADDLTAVNDSPADQAEHRTSFAGLGVA
jgi:hypothetical protein